MTRKSPVIYRLRMRDGSFIERISEETAQRFLRGEDWLGVVRGMQYITASRPEPDAHESQVIGFDEDGPQCVHPTYGPVRTYEPLAA